MPVVTPWRASIASQKAVPYCEVFSAVMAPMRRCSSRSSVIARHTSPRPNLAMKLIASGVTFSAARVRSPSFSRSSSSTTTIIRPARISSIAVATSVNGLEGLIHLNLSTRNEATLPRRRDRLLRSLGSLKVDNLLEQLDRNPTAQHAPIDKNRGRTVHTDRLAQCHRRLDPGFRVGLYGAGRRGLGVSARLSRNGLQLFVGVGLSDTFLLLECFLDELPHCIFRRAAHAIYVACGFQRP